MIMPPAWGRNKSALALAVIVLAYSLVAANVCYLGTEPDPADGVVKLVLPEDPCTCTGVRLGGHNLYAPPRPGGTKYIPMSYIKYVLENNLDSLFQCPKGKEDGAGASMPQATTKTPKSTPKATTRAQVSTAKAAPKTTPAASTPVDTTPALSSTPEPTVLPTDCQEIIDAGQTTGASVPQATTPKSTPKATTRAQVSTAKAAQGTTPAASTPVDTTPVLNSTAEPMEPPANCQDILDAGQTTSGMYTIQHAGQNMTVYCRMESGYGYIAFQRRLDGSVSFNRTWQEYAEGFGDLTGEFWLGNQKLHSLTGDGGWELVITLRAFDGDEARVRYSSFRIGFSNYILRDMGTHTDVNGDAGDSLSDQRGHFSTLDKDNDDVWNVECSKKYHGGWWYSDCDSDSYSFLSNLNGLYYHNATVAEPMQGIQWSTWKGNQVSLKGCEMMILKEEN